MAQFLRWSVIVRFRPVPGRDYTPRQVSRARSSRKLGPLVPSAPLDGRVAHAQQACRVIKPWVVRLACANAQEVDAFVPTHH